MANNVLLAQRNTFAEGSPTQTVNVLANNGNDYYIWTVSGIDVTLTDAQVQVILDGQVASVIAAILANGEIPLTPTALDQYQNIIDVAKISDDLVLLESNLSVLTTSSNIPNALSGLKNAFKDSNSAAYDVLSNTAKFTLLRQATLAIVNTLIDSLRLLRVLAKKAKRTP